MSLPIVVTLAEIFPIEGSKQGMLAHFFLGIAFIWSFWYLVEKQFRHPAINPFLLFFACLWGASGFFFFRWFFVEINIPILREKWFYTAFPDWDILILGRSAHRNLFFHSALFPTVLLLLAFWKKWVWLRDFAIGLTIGIAAHLTIDIVTYHGYPWHYIRHLDGYAGAAWVVGNIVLGLFLLYYIVGRTSPSIQSNDGETSV